MTVWSFALGLRSRFDRLLRQLENHEAIAQSAIVDLQAALSRAAAQRARLSRSGDRLRAEHGRAKHEAEIWRRRAAECSDDAAALDCLRRARQRTRASEEILRRLAAQQELEARLFRDVAVLEARFAEMTERHQELRARETRAQAYQHALIASSTADADDVFERWETQVTEQEYLAGPIDDWLELRNLAEDQETEELQSELATLRGAA